MNNSDLFRKEELNLLKEHEKSNEYKKTNKRQNTKVYRKLLSP